MNKSHESFQAWCASKDQDELMFCKARLLKERHIAWRLKHKNWLAVSDEMLDILETRLKYLEKFTVSRIIAGKLPPA